MERNPAVFCTCHDALRRPWR